MMTIDSTWILSPYKKKVALDEEYIYDSSSTKLVTLGYKCQYILDGELVTLGS
jgi:hypothetical protein